MNRTVIKTAALHRPAPQHLPVAVAGPRRHGRAAARRAQASGLQPYGTEHAARERNLNRGMDPARVPGPAQQRLLMAGAAVRLVTGAVTATFQAEAAGQRGRCHTEESP
ncbi:MAG TPA: hypothetical protein VIV12_00295 [Streptosporangiaceae bacterium]